MGYKVTNGHSTIDCLPSCCVIKRPAAENISRHSFDTLDKQTGPYTCFFLGRNIKKTARKKNGLQANNCLSGGSVGFW